MQTGKIKGVYNRFYEFFIAQEVKKVIQADKVLINTRQIPSHKTEVENHEYWDNNKYHCYGKRRSKAQIGNYSFFPFPTVFQIMKTRSVSFLS